MHLSTNNTVPVKIYSSGTFRDSQYKIDWDIIKEFNGTHIGNHMVSEHCISTNHKHQTRAKDYDKAHVKDLIRQINNVGLIEALIGQEDDYGNITILSGHHRMKALKQISIDNDEEEVFYPVVIVSFPNNIDREFYKQRENTKHKAAKSHNKNDAIKFLLQLMKEGHQSWDTRGDLGNLKTEAYKALTRAGYDQCIQTVVKKEVFDQVFKKKIQEQDTITAIGVREAEKKCYETFNVVDSNFWNDDEYVLFSSQDASRKTIHIAAIERAFAIDNNRVSLTGAAGKIKMLIHFPPGYQPISSLTSKRQKVLEDAILFNNYLGKGVNVIISEVVFPPQFRSMDDSKTETENITWKWDPQKQTFI